MDAARPRRALLAAAALAVLLRAPAIRAQSAGSAVSAGGARVSATAKGALKVDLTVYKTKLKSGESLLFRTSLTNLSSKGLIISDWVYRGHESLPDKWVENYDGRVYSFIEVEDGEGKPLRAVMPFVDGTPFQTVEISTFPDPRIVAWHAAGLSGDEINKRLAADEAKRESAERQAKYPAVYLSKGKTAVSASWCSGDSLRPGDPGSAASCPGAGFVEAPFYSLTKPGRYRVRLVYDSRFMDASYRPHNIRLATDWIAVEVVK